jgi:DNA repair exonuclease SbcCD ATPase subunit
MIEKIAHLADIHIRKTPTRNEEYEKVFSNLKASLEEEKPDRIVIVGDLVHDYLDLQGEQLIMAHDLLSMLSKIAPVRITRGNHDCRKKNLRRVDSVKAIVKTLNNPNVIYYDNTDVFYDDNIAWFVWHHGQAKNNPWKTKEGKLYEKNKITPMFGADGEQQIQYTSIDLFHDPVNGCKSITNFEMKSKSYYKISDFKGDLSFFGDIHKLQFFDDAHKKGMNYAQTKAYSGSLIAQEVDEGDDNFHGYLLWDVKNKVAEIVPIINEYSFKNIKITPYTDFDDLDFEIPNPTKYMKIRFVWGTLPQTRTRENERKLIEYVKSKYQNLTISHKNEFLENEKIDINENITLQNITDDAVQHEIFKEYLSKIGTDENVINDVIALDEEILKEIDIIEETGIEWNIIKFGCKDFMSYHEFDIDWRDKDGLYQITGENTFGKTTIFKLITYLLFGKALETETRMKYGDLRFVNNRNGAKSCEGYIVIEANGEYYGIKKKTEITRTKGGEINGAPTTLSYYILSNPDEEMDEKTSLEKLDEDRRIKTQKKIETIIGSYDNFMRIVMTTSDTLNKILSNDMSVFIDSILYDSGCDIFDKKLTEFKAYEKKVNEKFRVICNIEITTQQNTELAQEILTLEGETHAIETIKLPFIQDKIVRGRKYVEDLNKKLFKIDPEIYNLNVDTTKETIATHNKSIIDYKAREGVIKESIVPLKETYDVEKLKTLIDKKDVHKTNEYTQKMVIKSHETEKMAEEHAIEIINGDIFRAKAQGVQYKKDILELKESEICPTCGQVINKKEHRDHINEKIKSIEDLMFPLAENIKKWENIDKKKHLDRIDAEDKIIEEIQKEIEKASIEMESILNEIGTLTNEKNDVEKRKELQTELDQIPTKIQNEELKITLLQQKIDNHDNSLKQIEENKRIEKGIVAAKLKLGDLETEEADEKENVFVKKSNTAEKQLKIKNNETLIADFKIQEYRDRVMGLYKKCVHRDGIPRQMLANYILPKINLTLENILSVAPFKVWLDENDLRPKLVYNNRPISIIDCISASGKERTFASVVLKFALNQINVKAKPTIFLLDEVMGKLLDGSVEEFVEILQMIKNYMKKVLIIELKEEINPDYLINVQLDENGISSLSIE